MDTIDKINRILFEKKISGAELSRRIGVSTGVYSQWNRKTTKPSSKNIAKIAEALSVSVESLLPDNSPLPSFSDVTKKEASPVGEASERESVIDEIVDLLSRLSPEQLQQELYYLRRLADGREIK
jgi:transcriptional regulator with XRE-family HTH domain